MKQAHVLSLAALRSISQGPRSSTWLFQTRFRLLSAPGFDHWYNRTNSAYRSAILPQLCLRGHGSATSHLGQAVLICRKKPCLVPVQSDFTPDSIGINVLVKHSHRIDVRRFSRLKRHQQTLPIFSFESIKCRQRAQIGAERIGRTTKQTCS
jgi:hypothetical protein